MSWEQRQVPGGRTSGPPQTQQRQMRLARGRCHRRPRQAGTLGLPTSLASTPQPGSRHVDAAKNPTLLSAKAAGCSLNTYTLR